MKQNMKYPCLGAAYYPEDWDEMEVEGDIANMQKAGLRIARIGEFAWRKMEPKPGQYDFAWLHEVVDKLASAGIYTIMGTPTATPPIWLSQLYPDVMTVNDSGQLSKHGGRRNCCSNNIHYREASAKIVEALGREFGNHGNIIGWQLDNEIYSNNGCFCPFCEKGFRGYLEKKYENIETLNKAWNLNLFSQAYDSFDEIPTPSHAWHNPHLNLEWKLFQQGSNINFIHMQATILKPLTSAPIGTDMMPINGLDYEQMNLPLDIVQFNHYDTQEDLWKVMFWFDFIRTIKKRPFWNTETSTCWNGSTDIGQTMKPEGFCRVNSWLPVALGGEANMYWLWRTHWAGHELMHGSVLNATGRPMHIFGEVQQTAAEFDKASDFLSATSVSSDIAIHFGSLNWNMFETQSVISGLKYQDALVKNIYKPVLSKGLRPDVIGPKHTLKDYKVLISAFMMTLEDEDLPARIEEWVKDGGIWIVGPMTDIRTSIGTRYRKSPFGMLEELLDVHCLYQLPDREGLITAQWADGEPFEGTGWYDVFEKSEDSLVTITGGHSSIIGKTTVIKKNVGNGSVILLGSIPTGNTMSKLLDMACEEVGIGNYEVNGNVAVIPREGNGKKGLIVIECAGKHATCSLHERMQDIISEKIYEGILPLKPYEVYVLQEYDN